MTDDELKDLGQQEPQPIPPVPAGKLALHSSIFEHVDGVEQVLCVPADLLNYIDLKDRGVWPQDASAEAMQEVLGELTNSDNVIFVDRPQAEVSSDFVQLIPYCVIIRGREIFCYRRKGSEGRLTGLFSCGVGGHINPHDGESPYYAGLKRELQEELGLELVDNPPAQAFIYDDSNAVGKVHLGVVHLIRITLQQKLTSNDPALEQGDFWPISELVVKARVEPELYETWTQLVLRKIFA